MDSKNTQRTRTFLCILLCILLLVSGCSQAAPSTPSSEADTQAETETAAKETDPIPVVIDVPDEVIPEHTELSYSEMTYQRPDIDAIYANFDLALAQAGQENAEADLFTTYDTLLAQISEVSTMDTLATLQSEINLSDSYYEEEMTLLDNEMTRMDNRMNEVTEAILQSAYAQAFRERMGADFIERYEFYSQLNSPEIEDLSEQANALVTEYKKLLTKEYTSQFGDQTVTLEDLQDIEITTQEELNRFYDAYYDIYKKKNAECADIYRQLVQIRVEIARTLGYDSYTDYAYDLLGRDFSKEDAAQFADTVKQYIVPLYQELDDRYYNQIRAAGQGGGPGVEDGLPYLQQAFASEFPAAMGEALSYMLDHKLYILDNDPNMMQAAFTTLIDDFAAPFLFINTSVYSDPGTFFHEFGHYYNFYLMGKTRWNDSNNLDLAEVHSQGLELLMFEYYPDIYGENSDIMQISSITDLLYSIISGCCEDEFQQKVFENPDMSIEEMNQLHSDLYAEYLGFPMPYEWVEIHHHFETPFYYISYATSAASAFEIWEMSTVSRPAALAAYRSITQNTLNCGYLKPLENAGLNSPFDAGSIERIAETIRTKYLPQAPSHRPGR